MNQPKTGDDFMDLQGGPAFPFPTCAADGSCGQYAHPGMTLRDWFAGQALAGMLASGEWQDLMETPPACYSLADKMLAERRFTA